MKSQTRVVAALAILTGIGGIVPSVVGSQQAATTQTQVYKKAPQGELKIHIHFPRDWKATDKRPAIVFFFGGAWTRGTVEQFRTQAEYLATRGMVTARADYRVRSRHDVSPDKCVEDAKSAVRWLRTNAATLGIDPERIVASGGSAGGHIAACSATVKGLEAEGEDLSVSSKPNLLVLFNPVLNCTQLGNRFNMQAMAKQISPNLHLAKDTPPAIVFYGTKDRFLAHGRELVAKSAELGNEAQVYAAEGQPHGFFNRSPWKESTLYLADRFLAGHGYLEGEPTIKVPDGAELKTVDANAKE